MPGFWLGLAMLQTLFTREHNAICEPAARAQYPAWDDEEIFQRARLVNAALIAKIHTVEWTPAVISHPTTGDRDAGQLVRPRRRAAARSSAGSAGSEVISGIPGSEIDHYGVPYALTEEFVAVYRMHPLLRDDYDLRSVADDDATLGDCTFRDLVRPGGVDGAGQGRADRPALLLRHPASRPGHAAQLPAVPAGVRPAATAS